jgi:DNA-binding response OmpR family regulator
MIERCKCCGQKLPPEELPDGVHLSPIKQQIWQAIVSWPGIRSKEIIDWVYGHDEHGGPDSLNIVSVHVAQINKQLASHGLAIRGRNSSGYRLGSV